MRILIAGSGAVGCYFGARLQLAGHQVRFLARGNHRNVLQHNGLHLTVGCDNYHLDVTIADAVEDWDIVLLCVKSWQVGDVLASLSLPSGWRGTVVTTQNGVEAPDQVEAQIGAGQVLAGIVHGFFEVDNGGRVRHVGVAPRLIFNAIAAGPQATARSLAGALD